MKNIFLLLLIFINSFIQAQYTVIPDPCFELFLIQEGIDSEGTGDLQVLTSDISDITILEILPPCQIYDLTGIQDFESLEILNVLFMDLTELDVSQNLALKELHCSFNNLTELDISNNTELEVLKCTSNLLESLDISNNLLLTYLACPGNEIASFISGENTFLEFIQIGNNNLTSIDISSFINLNTLYCIMNQFNNIDLSQNTNIEKLGCQMNSQLETIDIRNGNNTNISEFITTETPNLTCIFVNDSDYSNDNWTEIDEYSTFVETETECDTLSIIGENDVENFSTFPNPTNDFINIKSKDKIFSAVVFNNLGEKVLNNRMIENIKIDLSRLRNGVYFLKVNTEKGSFIRKIVKE